MKNYLFIAIFLVALTSCKKMDQPVSSVHTLGTSAKYPGVAAALLSALENEVMPAGHTNCLFTDNGPGKGLFFDRIALYLTMIGEETPNASDVEMTYTVGCTNNPVEMDFVKVTYNDVTHTFWQDCTTTWDGETIPQKQQSKTGGMAPSESQHQ